MRSFVPVLLSSCVLACAHSSTSDPAASDDDVVAEAPTLPATLTGTLVATDESRRVLVVMGNLIATMESEVTDHPEYDLIDDVQCDAPFSCRVMANGCEGTITRQADASVVVAFAPVNGAMGADRTCAAYSGRFAVIDDPLLPEAPNRPRPGGPPATAGADPVNTPTPGLPRGRVLVGEASTSGQVDAVRARATIAAETDALEECYARYLMTRDEDGGSGSGIIRFTLDHGTSSPGDPRPHIEESTLADDALEGCVVGVVHGTVRLAPADGKRARVHYVLSFVGR